MRPLKSGASFFYFQRRRYRLCSDIMQMSFLQKLILTAVIGAVAAGVFQFYRHVIEQADQDLNGAYRKPRVEASVRR
jgi:hypothetical protein